MSVQTDWSPNSIARLRNLRGPRPTNHKNSVIHLLFKDRIRIKKPRSSRPWDKGRGEFSFDHQFGLKIRRGRGKGPMGPSPGSTTKQNSDFSAISVTEWSCAKQILNLDCHMLERLLPLSVHVAPPPPPHVKGYWERSGSKWAGVRAWTKWDGSKHSEVSSGSQGNKPSRPTAPVQCSKCVNNLFQLCAAAVHMIPESFLYLHKKLSSIVYSHPVKRFHDIKTHQSFYSNLEVALSSMNLS